MKNTPLIKNIFIFLISLLFIQCGDTDPLEENITSNIKGNISDNWNNIPFNNLKIKIAEYKSHVGYYNYSYSFIKFVDSTYTDLNGDYDLSFNTSGQGNNYRLQIEETPDLWNYYYNPIEIVNIGGSNEQDLDFLHLYPINLIINLTNVDFTPIKFNFLCNNSGINYINISNGQINRTILSNKNSETEIHFRRKNFNNIYENFNIIIPATNTTDLTDYIINIHNSDFN